MDNNDNILILKGPHDLLSLLKKELDEFDLDEHAKSMRRWCRISPMKTLYVVHFNSTEQNKQLADNIKMEIANLDPKAVVKYSEYMVEDIDKIGQYLIIHYSGERGCTDVLAELHKILL
jgi:hypothetical protein